MNKNVGYYIIIFLVIFGIFWAGFFCGKYYERSHTTPTQVEVPVIEPIVVVRDSLIRINDSINYKIIEVEKKYEEVIDAIISNDPNDDYNFFSDYTERYCGYNNIDSIKNSESDIR